MSKSLTKVNPELKGWKQTFIIENRQAKTYHKQMNKLFSFTNTIHPWNDIISKTLKQADQKQIAIQSEQKKITAKLKDIASCVNSLKGTLEHYQHTNQFLVKVQNSSETIYSKIEKFKSNMSSQFEEMIDQEEAIEADLKLYDDKIQSIIEGTYEGGLKPKPRMQENVKDFGNKQNKRLVSAKGKVKQVKQSTTQLSQQDQRIRVFQLRSKQILEALQTTEKYVQNIEAKIIGLGKNLGWVQEDHSDFIKIWNRASSISKNYFEIEDELAAYFKLYTEQQIRDHMNKHLKYKKLVEEKKEKIIEYKSLKEEKKVLEFEMLAEQQEKVRSKQIAENKGKKSIEQQQKMKQKVISWKQKKQQQKQLQIQHRRAEQQRRKESNMRRMLQNQQIKQALQQWRQQQEEIKSRKMIESRKHSSRPTIDKETEQRIRAREEKLVAEKMQGLIKKKIDQEERAKKEERLKQQKYAKYAYVNSKVEEKTTAIKEKERGKFDGKEKKDANTFGGNLLHAGVRATPGWMQGL